MKSCRMRAAGRDEGGRGNSKHVKGDGYMTTMKTFAMGSLIAMTAITTTQAGGGPTFGISAKAGPISASPDGTKCVSVLPVSPISPVFCENKKTGETSWGVSTPVGSLQLGGKGTDGKNNFIKITVSPPMPVTPQGSVKVPTPSLTRSGITGATTLK